MTKRTDSYYTTTERKERIDRAAKKLDRARSWIINKCLDIALPLLENGNQAKEPSDETG